MFKISEQEGEQFQNCGACVTNAPNDNFMTHSYTLQKSYTFNKSLIALVRLDSLNFGVGFHVEKGFFLKLREK